MPTSAINPAILRWARETASLSLEDAAAKLQLPAAGAPSPSERLRRMEEGEERPTRAMLGTMAKQYRRPLLTFYLAAPPRVVDRGSDFRTLGEHDPRQDALVDALLRDMRARQATLRSTLEIEDEAEVIGFVGSVDIADSDAATLAAEIASQIRFDLDEYRRQQDNAKAFRYLRDCVERAGVFVVLAGDLGSYHTEIDVEVFRGFAIADPLAPLVVVNDRDHKAARSFTLLHELTHVWLGQTGVSGGAPDRDVEQFCNDVASEILLPNAEIVQKVWRTDDRAALQRTITQFGRARNVSSSMVAYTLYRANVISRPLWSELLHRYRQLWLENRRREREERKLEEGGPSYYPTIRHKLGAALLSFAERMHSVGALSTAEAAQLLGVAPRQLQPLLSRP